MAKSASSHSSDSGSGAEKLRHSKDAQDAQDAAPKATEDDQDTAHKDLDKLDPALVGMCSGLKHLYARETSDKEDKIQWQATIPEDIGKPAEDAETARWAMIVRHIKVYNDPTKVLTLHSVVIQSPLLKELLKDVLKGYPKVTVDLARLEIAGRFEPLIHRFNELKAAVETLEKEGDFDPVSPTVQELASSEPNKIEITTLTDPVTPTEPAEGQLGPASKQVEGLVIRNNDLIEPEKTENAAPAGAVQGEQAPDSTYSSALESSRNKAQTGSESKPDEIEENALQVVGSPTDSKDTIKLRHAKLLIDLLVTEFKDVLDEVTDMEAKGVMTYPNLWALYQPRTMVYSRQEGHDRVFKFHSGEYGKDLNRNNCYLLTVKYVDFDGHGFGTSESVLYIYPFRGTKRIISLAAFPIQYHQDERAMRTRVIERGAKVEELAGTRFAMYEGSGWRYDRDAEKKLTLNVKSRVIVDAIGWNSADMVPRIRVKHFQVDRQCSDEAFMLEHHRFLGTYTPSSCRSCCSSRRSSITSRDDFAEDASQDGEEPDSDPLVDAVDGAAADEPARPRRKPLTDDQKLLCNHLVRAYSLTDKTYLHINAIDVREIEFNDGAFDSLVLPDQQKDLVLGFAATQPMYRHAFDDVIKGKGKGVILLLSGPPGVGKTLTAESVAEQMRVPLYTLSAGEVGADSWTAQERLKEVFKMVSRWGAVLLIDEADVFLEARSLENVHRNSLVSVFLQMLEYYEGILFLTTNRVVVFDAAFQSRIHVSLEYKDLTLESRKQIWTNFLKQHNLTQQTTRAKGPPRHGMADETSVVYKPLKKKTTRAAVDARTSNGVSKADQPNGDESSHDPEPTAEEIAAHELRTRPHEVSDGQILELARMRINGRQIKNILKTAQMLANLKKEPLVREHVETVLQVTQHLHNATRETEHARGAIFN